MDPREQFSEAVRRIDKLIEAALAPARRDSAVLAHQAPLAKLKRSQARDMLFLSQQHVARVGWIPFLGKSAHGALARNKSSLDIADQEWANILLRARVAAESLTAGRTAHQAAALALQYARGQDPPSPFQLDAISELLVRARFLYATDGRDAARAEVMAPKVFELAEKARNIALSWHVQSQNRINLPSSQDGVSGERLLEPGANPSVSQYSPAYTDKSVDHVESQQPRVVDRRVQMSLDLDGTGAVEVEPEPRIWLPVSGARTREMVERGARVDKQRTRGSKLWIPVSERSKLEEFLPLAFRRKPTQFSFPPIRHNAAKQNLWSMFDTSSWNHIRTTAYDRAGHRCQLCGKWKSLVPYCKPPRTSTRSCRGVP